MRVVDRPGRDAEIYANRARQYQVNGEYAQALAYYDLAVQSAPVWLYLSRRGELYLYLGKSDLALADFNRMVEIQPKSGFISHPLARVLEKGEYDKAIADCTRAFQIDPRDVTAYNRRGKRGYAAPYANRGSIYRKRHEYENALWNYDRAIKLDTTEALAYYGRGLTHGDQRHFEQAIADLTQAIEQAPKYRDAYYARALLYFGIKNYDKTWEDVRKVQAFGGEFDEEFLKELRRISGRFR